MKWVLNFMKFLFFFIAMVVWLSFSVSTAIVIYVWTFSDSSSSGINSSWPCLLFFVNIVEFLKYCVRYFVFIFFFLKKKQSQWTQRVPLPSLSGLGVSISSNSHQVNLTWIGNRHGDTPGPHTSHRLLGLGLRDGKALKQEPQTLPWESELAIDTT